MRTLALTTSSARSGVALLDGEAQVSAASIDDDRLHAERIFAMIDRCLAEAGWSKATLELVACDLGPGSFTGVRVGLASAKGIALGLGLPIVGVSSLEVMARAALGLSGGAQALAVLDARRDERFVAVFDAEGVRLTPRHVPTQEVASLAASLPEGSVWCGEPGVALDPARRVDDLRCGLPDAGWLGLIAARLHERRGPDDLATLEPLYVRAPDARLPTTRPDWRVAR